MKRVAIYDYQQVNEGCPACSQSVKKALIVDIAACKNRIAQIYGEGNSEYVLFLDRGNYLGKGLDRPEFINLMKAVKDKRFDIVIVTNLAKISTEVELVLRIYRRLKENGVTFITQRDGEDTESLLDQACDKWEEEHGKI